MRFEFLEIELNIFKPNYLKSELIHSPVYEEECE